MTKAELRKQLIEKRDRIAPAIRRKKEKQIIKKITNLTIFKKAKVILLYHPHRSEANLLPLMAYKKKTFIFPRVNRKKHTLTLHITETNKTLQKGSYGIFEPQKKTSKIHPKKLDLVLIPGVGFDLHGHRIGYGKGCFDRLLKTITCPVIGIAFSEQIIDQLPRETHDVPATLVLTEKNIIQPKAP